MLSKLLDIFARIVDAMEILNSKCNEHGKHAKEEMVRRCWRKAAILPVGMQADINADLGSLSTPTVKKTLSKEDSKELCDLMHNLSMKTKNLDKEKHVGTPLEGSFLTE